MTPKSHLANLNLSVPEKPLVFLRESCGGVLIRARQTGWNNSRGRLDYKSCEQLACLHGGLAVLSERGMVSAYVHLGSC